MSYGQVVLSLKGLQRGLMGSELYFWLPITIPLATRLQMPILSHLNTLEQTESSP